MENVPLCSKVDKRGVFQVFSKVLEELEYGDRVAKRMPRER